MIEYYSWIKVAHIVSVISWMVALLYLPRLMVYHADKEVGSDTSDTFIIMERRLLKGILTPAMIASWLFGLWLVVLAGSWSEGWFVSKIFLVLIMTFYSFAVAVWVKEFRSDLRKRSAKFFRLVNEIPAVIMIFIVILVVVKPF